MIRAVRAVLKEDAYAGRFDFVVFPWEHERSVEARDTYGFGAEQHGFALVTADGFLLGVLPGHDYGAAEIRQKLDGVLGR